MPINTLDVASDGAQNDGTDKGLCLHVPFCFPPYPSLYRCQSASTTAPDVGRWVCRPPASSSGAAAGTQSISPALT